MEDIITRPENAEVNEEEYYGLSAAYLKPLVEYWADGFDWSAAEKRLNGYAQYKVEIDGTPVHFVRKPGKGPNPTPLLILHGWPWPGEFGYPLIDPLADPAAHGGDPADAFDVIVPTLPGFAWSTPVTRDFILTQATVFRVTQSIGTSIRGYRNTIRHPWTSLHDRHPGVEPPAGFTFLLGASNRPASPPSKNASPPWRTAPCAPRSTRSTSTPTTSAATSATAKTPRPTSATSARPSARRADLMERAATPFLDTSHSMFEAGPGGVTREAWAEACALALLDQARHAGRDFVGIRFSAADKSKVFRFPADRSAGNHAGTRLRGDLSRRRHQLPEAVVGGR